MFTLKIKTQNATFEGDDKALEVARILRETASKIERGLTEGPAQDYNGNTVGTYKLTNR